MQTGLSTIEKNPLGYDPRDEGYGEDQAREMENWQRGSDRFFRELNEAREDND